MPDQQQDLIPQKFHGEELGPHMFAVRMVEKPGTTTCRWAIHAKRNKAVLGTVKWFGRWHQYVFHPAPLTLFNNTCMDEISGFLRHNRDTRQEVDDAQYN